MGMGMTIDTQFAQGATSAEGFAQRCLRVCSGLGRFMAARISGKIRSDADNALRIEEKLSLGPKKMLYLVSCREKEFLVATGADAIVSVLQVSPVMPLRTGASKAASLPRMQKRERLL